MYIPGINLVVCLLDSVLLNIKDFADENVDWFLLQMNAYFVYLQFSPA